MLANHHMDLLKYKYLIRLSPRNAKSDVMTVIEAAILPEMLLRKCSEPPFGRVLCCGCCRNRHFDGSYIMEVIEATILIYYLGYDTVVIA